MITEMSNQRPKTGRKSTNKYLYMDFYAIKYGLNNTKGILNDYI